MASAEEDDTPGLILPSGPVDAAGMFIGEAGGVREHATRRPFAGKTGLVLTAYCRAAGLARPDIRITNVYPFWTGPGNPDPTPEQIARESWRLEAEIARVRPRVICTLGRHAAEWFFGDEMEPLEVIHGVPMMSDRAPDSIIVPGYHPASGFYNPELASYAQDDILQFAYLLKNPVEVKDAPRIRIVLHEEAPAGWIDDPYVDTEGLEDRPWGLSWYVGDRDPDGTHVGHVWIYAPGKRRPRFRGRVKFHNAPHDLKILRAMGYDTTEWEIDDTMVRSFNLRLEPQALKALSFRHLGLKMKEFDETVRPHYNRVALAFLNDAIVHAYPRPSPIVVDDYQKKKTRLYKPQGVGQRMKNILRTIAKKPDAKIEKRWAKLGETSFKVDFTERFQWQAERAVGRTFPDFSIFHVPLEEAVTYSGTDAVVTGLVDAHLTRSIKAKSLESVYEMDRRALPFVDSMQETGLGIDLQELYALEADLEDIRGRSLRRIQKVTGNRWFNPGSGDQVGAWLYSYKGLPIKTWTESGKRGSTADAALKMLRGYHKEDAEVVEFISAVDEYREADKYLGTFVAPIFVYMKQDENGIWRIHSNFRVTRVVSGRLSSHEPNVLAIPTRTKLGRRIRKVFKAADGYVLLSVDESQVELRVMADHSGDRRMRQAFENDEDLHAITCSIVFKIPLAEVIAEKEGKHKSKRYLAKVVNFAVMYGISARALLDQLYKEGILDFELEDCQRFIDEWFVVYHTVRRWLEKTWARAEVDGFVRDMWGRMCYVPNLRVLDGPLQEAARRLAGNFPIQSGAHGLVKEAEAMLYRWVKKEGMRKDVRPWLQLHDELLVETRVRIVDEVADVVKGFMLAHQEKLRVPLKTDAAWGKRWSEL